MTISARTNDLFCAPASAPAASPEPGPGAAIALAAIRDRDQTFDGRFVYAVRTTGIFCRPSCPSRRPRPENISIYADASSAAANGFRPCKRCRPEGDGADPAIGAVAAACARIDAAHTAPSLGALAAAAGFSPFHFHRLFRRVTGLTPRAYAEAGRKRRVTEALEAGSSVTGALYEAGYGASSRFYAGAGSALGMAPAVARRGGPGERIGFSIAPSTLGLVLVASTAQGVCAILLGDDAEGLEADLRRRFRAADIGPADEAFVMTVAAVVALLEAPERGADLPLDIRGTVFQEQVWRALAAVPAGTTVSYADLAARIGRPSASRAVAQACARNPLAVAVPCHRVVGKDGSLGGYRWGEARKRALLDREKS